MRLQSGQLRIETATGVDFVDLMPHIHDFVAAAGIDAGLLSVSCRHTTTAIVINERETRLLEDARRFFEKLAPAADRYYHNDIALRDCPADEPRNAHSHLLAMLLGRSETIPVTGGIPDLGQWQTVMLVELDGPRTRTVSLQLLGE